MKTSLFIAVSVLALALAACQAPSTGHEDDRPFNIQTRNFESPRQAGGTDAMRQPR